MIAIVIGLAIAIRIDGGVVIKGQGKDVAGGVVGNEGGQPGAILDELD